VRICTHSSCTAFFSAPPRANHSILSWWEFLQSTIEVMSKIELGSQVRDQSQDEKAAQMVCNTRSCTRSQRRSNDDNITLSWREEAQCSCVPDTAHRRKKTGAVSMNNPPPKLSGRGSNLPEEQPGRSDWHHEPANEPIVLTRRPKTQHVPTEQQAEQKNDPTRNLTQVAKYLVSMYCHVLLRSTPNHTVLQVSRCHPI